MENDSRSGGFSQGMEEICSREQIYGTAGVTLGGNLYILTGGG
jgi:hypothetical protein